MVLSWMNKKLKAGAMYYAIAMSLLISSISGLIVMLGYFHRGEVTQLHLQEKLQMDARSGMQVLLAQNGVGEYPQLTEVDLFDDEQHIVKLKKNYWGLYYVNIATAKQRQYQFSQVTLTGNYHQPDESPALYLADKGDPLSLCGKTRIVGNSYIPKAGLKRAYIEGQNYIGSNLLYGSSQQSQKSIPAPDNELLAHNRQILQTGYTDGQAIYWEDNLFTDSLVQGFDTITRVLIAQTPLTIGNGAKLKGNVVVWSSQPILITRNAQIVDALIYAPRITVQNGFEGSVQLFTKDSLVIQDRVKLQYPSSVSLFNADSYLENPQVVINKEASVQGSIYVESPGKLRRSASLTIEEDATAEGIVYVNGNVQLKGSVHGSLYCNKFYLKTRSSVYENYLLNAEIDNTLLSEHFVQTGLVKANSGHQKIVKWLR